MDSSSSTVTPRSRASFPRGLAGLAGWLAGNLAVLLFRRTSTLFPPGPQLFHEINSRKFIISSQRGKLIHLYSSLFAKEIIKIERNFQRAYARMEGRNGYSKQSDFSPLSFCPFFTSLSTRLDSTTRVSFIRSISRSRNSVSRREDARGAAAISTGSALSRARAHTHTTHTALPRGERSRRRGTRGKRERDEPLDDDSCQ